MTKPDLDCSVGVIRNRPCFMSNKKRRYHQTQWFSPVRWRLTHSINQVWPNKKSLCDPLSSSSDKAEVLLKPKESVLNTVLNIYCCRPTPFMMLSTVLFRLELTLFSVHKPFSSVSLIKKTPKIPTLWTDCGFLIFITLLQSHLHSNRSILLEKDLSLIRAHHIWECFPLCYKCGANNRGRCGGKFGPRGCQQSRAEPALTLAARRSQPQCTLLLRFLSQNPLQPWKIALNWKFY